MDTPRDTLPDKQAAVLALLIEFVKTHGYTPGQTTLMRAAEERGLSPWTVRPALISLERKGYAKQPEPQGPWTPLRDPDGRPLSLLLIHSTPTEG